MYKRETAHGRRAEGGASRGQTIFGAPGSLLAGCNVTATATTLVLFPSFASVLRSGLANSWYATYVREIRGTVKILAPRP
jgi:hypothetical protein